MNDEPLPFQTQIDPLGCRFDLRSNDRRPIERLRALFGADGGDAGSASRMEIVVREGAAGPGSALPPVPRFEIDGASIDCRFGASSMRGDFEAGRFRVEIAGEDFRHGEWLGRSLLDTPILATIHRRTGVVVHAAALAAPGGGAILLRAGAGGGKSTLAAAWLLAGGEVLSDETAWLPVDGRRELFGFGTAVDLLPESVRLLGLPPGEPGRTPDGESKCPLPTTSPDARESRRRRAPLGAVVVLDRSPSRPPAFERIAADRCLRLFRESRIAEEAPFDRQERTLGALLGTVPAFLLSSGGDPVDGARRMREGLARFPDGSVR